MAVKKSPSGKKSAKKKENVHSFKSTQDAEKNSNSDSQESSHTRKDHRIPIQLLVDYKAKGNFLFDFCYNLGSGGVFIQTEKPLPKGSELELVFTLPDSKQTLRAKGLVMWAQQYLPEMKQVTPGMGVQFRDFTMDDRRILEAFLKRYRANESTIDKSA